MKATIATIVVVVIFCAGVAYKFFDDENKRAIRKAEEADQMAIPKAPASVPTKSQ